jgi:hypothetical protein
MRASNLAESTGPGSPATQCRAAFVAARRAAADTAPMTASGTPHAPATAREPIVTPAVVLAVLAAAGAVATAWWSSHPTPDLPGAIRLLGDGDLDGAESKRMLARVLALAPAAAGPAQTWAIAVAALLLDDDAAWAEAAPRVAADVAAGRAPAPSERRELGLGEVLGATVRDAWLAEAAHDRAAARAAWARARDLALLANRRVAAAVATAALVRLGG